VDIVKNCQLRASCYLSKSSQLREFKMVVKRLNDFWLTRVKLLKQMMDPMPDS
jgi:hypothetical protein